MGTSSSSRGPGSGSPLVPDWVDDNQTTALPNPQPGRFRAFRTNLGQYVASGEHGKLRRALGHYARTSTEGSSVGPRRFGSMAQSGGALFGLISDLRQGGDGQSIVGADLSLLSGQNTDYAIDQIATVLTPQNGDSDKIRKALTSSLSRTLIGMEQFDPSSINEDTLVDILVNYVRECVYEQIIMDSDRAFQKSDNLDVILEAEKGLHALVDIVVGSNMKSLFDNDADRLTQKQLVDVQLAAIREVWKEWERYE